MRTSLADQLLALKRPAALAALGIAAAGWIGAQAPMLATWSLAARVQALDTVGSTGMVTMPGADASPVVWVASAAGVTAVVVAVLVALDRPPPHTEAVLVTCALLLVAVSGLVALQRPAVDDFAHDARAAEVLVDPEPLPVGVDIELHVRPARGLWVLAAAGPLVGVGTALVRRSG